MFALGFKHSTCIAKKEYHQHDEQLNRILIEMNGIAQKNRTENLWCSTRLCRTDLIHTTFVVHNTKESRPYLSTISPKYITVNHYCAGDTSFYLISHLRSQIYMPLEQQQK